MLTPPSPNHSSRIISRTILATPKHQITVVKRLKKHFPENKLRHLREHSGGGVPHHPPTPMPGGVSAIQTQKAGGVCHDPPSRNDGSGTWAGIPKTILSHGTFDGTFDRSRFPGVNQSVFPGPIKRGGPGPPPSPQCQGGWAPSKRKPVGGYPPSAIQILPLYHISRKASGYRRGFSWTGVV